MCIKLSNKAICAFKFLRFAKSIETRLWWTSCPLRQFSDEIKNGNALYQLEKNFQGKGNILDNTLSLLEMSHQEVGELCHWYKGGRQIQKLVTYLPLLDIVDCVIQPISYQSE